MSESIDLKNVPPHLKNLHSWHFDMLLSKERNDFYNDLIKDNCKDKVVFEIGTGSGLLSVLAVRHGARKVICCEENPLLIEAATQLFQRLGVADKIQLIQKNSKDIKTEELPPVDVVLHELFGSDPFEEEFIPTLQDARRFMKPDGIFLPDQLQIIYQVVPQGPIIQELTYDGISLIEMNQILPQVHPGLRVRNRSLSKTYKLPPVKITSFLEQPYSYTHKNSDLVDIDALEVTYLILHQDKVFQAAEFATVGLNQRVHWFPLIFSKMDPDADQVTFQVEDRVKLSVL
jgi:16S rRNA G966 N2-methylase RsmD